MIVYYGNAVAFLSTEADEAAEIEARESNLAVVHVQPEMVDRLHEYDQRMTAKYGPDWRRTARRKAWWYRKGLGFRG